MKNKTLLIALLIALLPFIGCKKSDAAPDNNNTNTENADPLLNKGIGPIKSVTLEEIDPAKVKIGKKVWESKCAACHKFNERIVGPPMAGISTRRSPEWILNMILNTKEMVEKDPIASDMVAVYMTKMTYQDVSEDEARGLLDYFRQYDAKNPPKEGEDIKK